jgi:uncharacterized protein (DUF58 family)
VKIKYNGIILIGMAIVLYAAASNTQSGWQYLITALILSIIIVSFVLPAQYLRGIEVEKFMPVTLKADRNTKIHIMVKNLSGVHKRYFNIEDIALQKPVDKKIESSDEVFLEKVVKYFSSILVKKSLPAQFFLRMLPGKDIVDFKYEYFPPRRGIFKSGDIRLSTSSPLGIFSATRIFKYDDEIIVYPKTVDIRGGWVNRIAKRSIVTQLSYSYSPTSIPGITRSIREYVPGDSPKHIHWPTSAKLDKLFVREFEIEASGHIVIFLDCSSEYETDDQFELAVTTAASLLSASHEKGLETRFVTQEDAYIMEDFVDENDWNVQLEVLARVDQKSSQKICTVIDEVHQGLIAQHPGIRPTYILISSQYKAQYSANNANIISITVSPRHDEQSHYTISDESDLKFI